MPDFVKRLPQASQVPRLDTSRSSADFFSINHPNQSITCGVSPEPFTPPEPSLARSTPGPLGRRQEWKLSRGATQLQQSRSSEAQGVDLATDELQNALERLQKKPQDHQRQSQAHAALTQTSNSKDNPVLPILHKALQTSLAGAIPTFGVGRTLGVHYGPQWVPLSHSPGLKTAPKTGVQWVLGAAGGGVGNLLGKTLIAPVVDTLPRHFRPIDPSVILTDRMVAKMNRVRSGWGDEVRAEIVAQQKEISRMDSDTNIHFGERAFGVATAARFLLQPQGFKPTLTKSLALSSGVAGLASAAVGTHMGVNMARAVVRVPRQETLEGISVSQARPDHEQRVMEGARDLPLFYVHQTPDDQRRGPLQAIAHRWHRDDLRDPVPTWQNPSDRKLYPNWSARMHGVASDVQNLGLSAASRTEHMMRATLAPTVLGAVQPFVEASLPGSFSARVSGVLLPVLAVRMIIRPWFEALMGGIPARDAEIRAKRQAVVDALPPPRFSAQVGR